MLFREATIDDVIQIQIVRNSVNENALSDPALVTDADCIEYLTKKGRGWVCEINSIIVGFSIVDLKGSNVWALFVNPDFEKKGIGKQLHHIMMHWYFNQTKNTIWLSTAAGTRAETFYRLNGWQETGFYGKGEIKFEMSYIQWKYYFI